MEMADLISIAIEAYPELKARGFFTVIQDSEYYFSGFQKMEIESAYKGFYEEYDLAFSVTCRYSICDCKTESGWRRREGESHEYKTPMLYLISRSEFNASPAQIVNRMVSFYRANALLIEKYDHPDYSVDFLKSYLQSNGMHLIQKQVKQKPEFVKIKKFVINRNHQSQISHLKSHT